MTTADEKVARYVLTLLREGSGSIHGGDTDHLRACLDVRVEDADGSDGTYGCDTGCDYVTLTATVVCPHGRGDFEWGDFGHLAYILEDLDDQP